jgi:small-conductance mechanosensitive channel
MKAPSPDIFMTKFDDSSINLSLRFWIDSKWEYFSTKSNVSETINLAFKQVGIVIPFPQVTLSNRSDFKINMIK